jgi:hypothetical protein
MEMIGGREVNHKISTWFINWGRVGVPLSIGSLYVWQGIFWGEMDV